ncbi:NADP-reducing hydrogenase, subunit B [Desulforapulum autotrophicum HRM2]|uniref:NADP-reducing hydrogenase, subunit B n=1 Tax=Desulforapulum autotrophicum (strain ATCC 43914 / DSM 3382 / VKM B-1955 / HRM2) TaxID=177437 RepID=C0QAH5_DESAH|nr:(2Fe-2S) ferredoxin domain-containing protein [Desulforapulum autotrophicum]ACN14760.1 NADP-reducing hydrogenase, subunit B [Desulforapulum autotrophicum HRM2]
MAKISVEDLKRIKEKTSQESSLRGGETTVKVTVHMGTCGIAAGARSVMNTLLEEKAESNRTDIKIVAAGCLGMCSSEPNITVEIVGQEPIVYKKMDPNKTRQVFRRHILKGEVQTDFALGKG